MPQSNHELIKSLQKSKVRLKKGLGQSLLTDETSLAQIVDAVNPTKDDVVFEIGTGTGQLTEGLAHQAGNVITVEIDREVQSLAKRRLSQYGNIAYILGDILEMDLMPFVNNFPGRPFKIVGNLPYYITTPILMKLIETEVPFASIVIMIQKEVADRIMAVPDNKDYGVLTLSVQYRCQVERVADVPRKAFFPAPEVDSTVLRLARHTTPPVPVTNEKVFFNTIKAGFGQRRKKISNAMASFAFTRGLEKDAFVARLRELNISPDARGEQLSMSDFARLANSLT